MWVARCRGGYLFLYENKPFRNEKYGGWDNIGGGGIITLDSPLFTELKWEDEPLEVDLITKEKVIELEECKQTVKVLQKLYMVSDKTLELHTLKSGYPSKLVEYQTNKIYNLTMMYRGIQLEEVSDIIMNTEEKIRNKYKMTGNPNCSQNCRMVTIPHSSIQISDNSLREYIDDDKVVATIYVRRNDFNTADILVSDFGERYYNNKLQ